MTTRDQAYMRGQLASIGILLDPAAPAQPSAAPAEPSPVEIDRDGVRAILVAAGAPPPDLEWLTASCPSLEAAKGYRAPPRSAWCARCGGVSASDGNGCIACRGGR